MGIDIKNHNETIKNYIKAQESVNKKNELQFWTSTLNFVRPIFSITKNNRRNVYIRENKDTCRTVWAAMDTNVGRNH